MYGKLAILLGTVYSKRNPYEKGIRIETHVNTHVILNSLYLALPARKRGVYGAAAWHRSISAVFSGVSSGVGTLAIVS